MSVQKIRSYGGSEGCWGVNYLGCRWQFRRTAFDFQSLGERLSRRIGRESKKWVLQKTVCKELVVQAVIGEDLTKLKSSFSASDELTANLAEFCRSLEAARLEKTSLKENLWARWHKTWTRKRRLPKYEERRGIVTYVWMLCSLVGSGQESCGVQWWLNP